MLFKTPLLDPFGIYFFHILYSRQLKRLKDVQRPLFFQNSVMGRQGTCIKMKASLTMLKALSLSGMKTGYFLLHISASNIHLFLCSNGRCMTWVHEGTSKSRKCTSRAKSCPSPRYGKGSEKQKRPILTMEFLRNPTKPTKRMESLWNFLMFLVSFFFSQTRGLSASLLFAALGPMSKEQLEVLWPSRAVMSPIFFWRTAKLQSENQKSMNIPEVTDKLDKWTPCRHVFKFC